MGQELALDGVTKRGPNGACPERLSIAKESNGFIRTSTGIGLRESGLSPDARLALTSTYGLTPWILIRALNRKVAIVVIIKYLVRTIMAPRMPAKRNCAISLVVF